MRARLALALALLAATGPACSTSVEDDALPDCALHNGSAVILMAQAVPTAELIPCIADALPGWRFIGLEARRGEASFTLESDEVGGDVLEVRLAPACPTAADETLMVLPGASARLSRDVVVTAPPELLVKLVPVTGRHAAAAQGLAAELEEAGLLVSVAAAGGPSLVEVDWALRRGDLAVVVDDLALTDAVVHVHGPADPVAKTVDLDDIEDHLLDVRETRAKETYRGTWQFRFQGGCVTYAVDATGPGAADLGDRIPQALSFVSRATLDRFTRVNVGLRLDP